MAQMKLFSGAIPAAGTTVTVPIYAIDAAYLLLQAVFDYGSGGTTVDAYVQTSLDGVTWVDVANFSFATTDAVKLSKVNGAGTMAANYAPTDGTLTANTVKDGLIGEQYRVKFIVVGTYVASTLTIYGAAKR